MENSRNKQLLSFKLFSVLSSHSVLSHASCLCPGYAHQIFYLPVGYSVAILVVSSTVTVPQGSCLTGSAPECSRSDACGSDVPDSEMVFIYLQYSMQSCYNCSIFILIITNDLLLYAIYKICFLISIYRKKTIYTEFNIICGFRIPLGILDVSPVKRGIYIYPSILYIQIDIDIDRQLKIDIAIYRQIQVDGQIDIYSAIHTHSHTGLSE